MEGLYAHPVHYKIIEVSFFLSLTFLSTHFWCRGLLLHLIALYDTRAYICMYIPDRTPLDEESARINKHFGCL